MAFAASRGSRFELPPMGDGTRTRARSTPRALSVGSLSQLLGTGVSLRERRKLLPTLLGSTSCVGPASTKNSRRSPVAQAKTFVITGNPECANLEVVRQELLSRNFVELDPESRSDFDLKWGPRVKVDWKTLSPPKLVNHFECDSELTTKSGLAENLQAASSPVDSRSFYPACFPLDKASALQEFALEFKYSKACCVLKEWLSHQDKTAKETFQEGVVRTALRVVKRRLADIDAKLYSDTNEAEQVDFRVKRKEWDILLAADFDAPQNNVASSDWQHEKLRRKLLNEKNKQFIEQYDRKLQQLAEQVKVKKRRSTKKLKEPEEEKMPTETGPLEEDEQEDKEDIDPEEEETSEPLEEPTGSELRQEVEEVVESLKQHPQFDLNQRNVWILKPANSLRGHGIIVENDLDRIFQQARNKTCTYVCQKYIENPLLIGARKHDIRQWVLVTSLNPLTIYFYSECYIRIAANEYTLDDFADRFTHLTHTIIMKHHPNYNPDDEDWRCQWTQERYRRLLHESSGRDVWTEKVRPAMQQVVIASLQSVAEVLSRPQNSSCSFQLFGYDFMVDADYNVWLLEVNDIPLMQACGPVTSRLCDSCVRDAISVVIDGPGPDRREPAEQGTLKFELIHEGPKIPKLPGLHAGVDLSIEGQKVSLPKKAAGTPQPSPHSLVRLSARRVQELQDLVDRRRHREDQEVQKKARQQRLRRLLAKKLLGPKSTSSPCLNDWKAMQSDGDEPAAMVVDGGQPPSSRHT
ncbi:TTLL3B [Symbiodinium natans]|uniref:TTLL3B protein n=1 Tax=Symbiodinium natans TaxID=878477 RepID=A0A812K6G0_9DINO|nr:TTLL3B [Symbiodinium natans]